MTDDEKITLALKNALAADIAEYEKLPDHKFSREFEKRTKRLLKENLHHTAAPCVRRAGKKVTTVAFALVTSLFLVGAASTTYVLWKNFHIENRGLYSLLHITDIENCPTTLEEHYRLTADLSGFIENVISDNIWSYFVEYDNDEKNIRIAFSQHTKNTIAQLNTEGMEPPKKVTVNGCNGIYYETRFGDHCLIWDTGDYLISLSANGIGKNELFELAKFVQKVE